jgi:hypothetical protein
MRRATVLAAPPVTSLALLAAVTAVHVAADQSGWLAKEIALGGVV